MKIILIGSTGMLGQALKARFTSEKFNVVTVSRRDSNYNLNILLDGNRIIDIIKKEKPDVVINCAAIVNLKYCEENPGDAYLVNSRFPGLIALVCQEVNSYFVQISTDHYYFNENTKKHNEADRVILLNEYARSKFAGEVFSLRNKNSLIIRTNIVGFRNNPNQLTFVEWVINSLNSNEKITGYDNYFTSSIDIYTFSEILTELLEYRIHGIINIGSKDVVSKYEFIKSIATFLNKEEYVSSGKLINENEIKRADSLGLDVSKLHSYLKRNTIPSSEEVIIKLISKYKEGVFYEI